LVAEIGSRKHDGEDGEDKRQYKDSEKGGRGNGFVVTAAGGALREARALRTWDRLGVSTLVHGISGGGTAG